ncbi:MAG TPA: response regulator [Bacteroidia bacterium]|jgi:DNA-binding NarL/FixJ family response regulator|nr:response regulator [Bacteroidia bacterium]
MLSGTREHIFIVEDNEIYSMMLDYILSKDSVYKFSNFKSGEECIRNLYQNPDVVILDYALPGINGYEVLREIKKYNPEIHVLILSNNTDPGLKQKLLEAGADDYILKQGHGENQVIERIESLLAIDEWKESMNARTTRKLFLKRVLYFIITLSVILFGVMIYKLK